MRLVLFGDVPGIPQLLRHVPADHVVGIVAASIRPQYVADLERIAEELHVPFMVQPKPAEERYAEFKAAIARSAPDLIWVNSYSMIVRHDILKLARLGGINIHAAPLPRYRGCNPTQWSMLNGEHETGVTLHEMTDGPDEGPVIDQRTVPLLFEDTWLTARSRIAREADDLIQANLSKVLAGSWQARPQNEARATYGRRRTPEDSAFAWSEPVVAIYNKVRALLPPLPPAFHRTRTGERVELREYLTPAAVTALKYSFVGGAMMQSEAVRLRPLRRDDAALLYEWINHRELAILNAPIHPVSEADHDAWIESMLTKRTDLVIFVIEARASETAIGTCQLININWRHQSGELQIRIDDRAMQGRGVGSEAVRLLCEFGFKDLNLHRIYLHVFVTTTHAMRVYENCGFRNEGTLRQAAFIDGAWVDVQVMGLLNPGELA